MLTLLIMVTKVTIVALVTIINNVSINNYRYRLNVIVRLLRLTGILINEG